MKVLLINPPFSPHGPYSVRIPLGVTYLASVIKDKHEVKILDLQIETVKRFRPATNIKKILKSFKPEVVCICHTIAANYPYLNILAKQVKKFDKDIVVMAGGYFPTVNPKTTFNENKDFVDIIVRGEGEEILPNLLEKIKRKEKIPNIIKTEPIKDLNENPIPARDILNVEDYRKYSYAEEYTLGSIITSRGCPFSCSWCVNKDFLTYRERDLGNVIKEIKLMKSEFGINKFKIEDETFTFNRKRVLDFCRKIKPLRVNWFVKTRADLLDDKLIQVMYNSGMRKMLIGFEDLNLDNIKKLKGFSKKNIDYNHIISEVNKYKDLRLIGTFLVGYPKIRPEEIIESLKWADRNFRKGDFFFMSYYLPPKIDDLKEDFISIDKKFLHWTLNRPVIENKIWKIKDYKKVNKLYRKIIRKKLFLPYLSDWNNDLEGWMVSNIKYIYRKFRNTIIRLNNFFVVR